MLNTVPLRIVLCHPFNLLRDALAQLLRNEMDCQIVGTFAQPTDAIAAAAAANADVLLLDLTYLEGMAGLTALKRARKSGCMTRSLVLVDALQSRFLHKAGLTGIDAWMPNTASAPALLAEISAVARNDTPVYASEQSHAQNGAMRRYRTA